MKAVMIVSAVVDDRLRRRADRGDTPTPEFIELEHRYGVELFDWSIIDEHHGHRSLRRSLKHVHAVLESVRQADVVLSDGEHVGIPLAMEMWRKRIRTPHIMLGHNLLTGPKIRALRHLPVMDRIDQIVIHSSNQTDEIVLRTSVPRHKITVIPYGIDTAFWGSPAAAEEPDLVVSAGREHRDYRTLVAALPPSTRLVIADHSPFTPDATRQDPPDWPPSVQRVALTPISLRDLYSRAAVVVIPLVDSPMPAGITTLLESMAAGKAVVATETRGLRSILSGQQHCLAVSPGDVDGLGNCIERLIVSSDLRASMGTAAQQAARRHFDVRRYVDLLFGNMVAVSRRATSENTPFGRSKATTG